MVARLKKKIDERKKNQQTEKSVPKMFSSIKVTKENGTFAEIMKGVPTKQSSLPQQQPQQYDQTIIQQLTTRIDSMAKTIEQQSEQIAQLLQIIGQL
jgi:biopolymer transport protein ExbB/TolQ